MPADINRLNTSKSHKADFPPTPEKKKKKKKVQQYKKLSSPEDACASCRPDRDEGCPIKGLPAAPGSGEGPQPLRASTGKSLKMMF